MQLVSCKLPLYFRARNKLYDRLGYELVLCTTFAYTFDIQYNK